MTELRSEKRIAYCGMFTAVAVIMGYIESFIVIPGVLPGMKIGLANSVVLFVLMAYGVKSAALVSIVRVVIVNSLFGSPVSAAFGIAGAVFSLLVMYLLKRTKAFSAVGISMAGGVAHNLGQTLVAVALFENADMFYYFPMLIIFGMTAGLFVGLVSGLVYRRLKKH